MPLFRAFLRGLQARFAIIGMRYMLEVPCVLHDLSRSRKQSKVIYVREPVHSTVSGTLALFINFFRNLHYDSYKSSHLGTLRRD